MKKSLFVLFTIAVAIAAVLVFKKRLEQTRTDSAEQAWRVVGTDTSSESLRRFIERYPHSRQAAKAQARLDSLTMEREWERVLASGSAEDVERFLVAYPTSSRRAEASELLERLKMDSDWQRTLQSNTPEAFRDFFSKYPQSPYTAKAESLAIAAEVAGIMRGVHDELPAPKRVDGSEGETSIVEIENQTRYTLTVRYSGPTSTRLTIKPKGHTVVTLKNGRYKVAASVDNKQVIPFAGENLLEGGQYTSRYFIRGE